ncbi:Lytic transglycosylase, catalytic, partial [Escherichia coli]|nr:Lytic transglycosylase, catalytic [Escherichia coli]EJI8960946.1 Lytic transglycosylase, catalytic [Escherichia coli]
MPVVPTVSGRQVESRGVQSAGLQTFSQPGISDAFVRAGAEAIDVLGQAKQRANIALVQEASLKLSQTGSDLLNNPETGLLNLKGKNAIGKGHEYTQQFDAQVEQLAMSLPDEQARNAFMQQAQQQRIQFTTQAGRYEIGQVRQYEADMQDATLKNLSMQFRNPTMANQAGLKAYHSIIAYGEAHGQSQEEIEQNWVSWRENAANGAAEAWYVPM